MPAGWLAGRLPGWPAGCMAFAFTIRVPNGFGSICAYYTCSTWIWEHLRVLYVFQIDLGAFALIICIPNGFGSICAYYTCTKSMWSICAYYTCTKWMLSICVYYTCSKLIREHLRLLYVFQIDFGRKCMKKLSFLYFLKRKTNVD